MKKLVEQTKLWEYEDTSGGMPPQCYPNIFFDTISQYPPQYPPAKPSVQAIVEAIVEAIDPSLLQCLKEKESSNGHDIGTFSIFHIVNHNIRYER
jgi:hypothetical protein